MISVSSLASRVDGVWGVGLCCLLPSLRCLGKWAAPLGWGATCASLGAGRVATVAALLCACVRRAALGCFVIPPGRQAHRTSKPTRLIIASGIVRH